jgi:hypothetical protein
MELNKLLEPYSEDGRTIEGQVKWLLNKGIPKDHIDKALLSVYADLEKGKTFESGHHLDHELLRVAKDSHTSEITEQIAKLESFFNGLKAPEYKFTRWDFLKAFFTGHLNGL